MNTGSFSMSTSDLSLWNTSSATTMVRMFENDYGFNQDITKWDIHNVIDMTDMFTGVNISTSLYDSILNSWASQSVQHGVTFSGGYSQYSCAGQSARDTLINTYGWIITDGGLNESCSPACVENWTQDLPDVCDGLISDYAITYTDQNTCGTTLNLPVDNGTIVPCCVEDWIADSNACSNYQELISYMDSNSCGTSFQLPSNNNTYFECGRGGGSVVESVSPITGEVTAPTTSSNIIARIFQSIWSWFKGLFGG
jgi:hypothetical protein